MFTGGHKLDMLPTNEVIKVSMALMYSPDNEYIEVVQGATFTLREGARIVGYGKVLNRFSE